MTVKPISPGEIPKAKAAIIPPEVVEAVNELLVKKFIPGGSSVTILQDDIMDLALDKMIGPGEDASSPRRRELRSKLFDDHAMDFESLFEEHGWEIVYDKPAYNESYASNFTFYVAGTRRSRR